MKVNVRVCICESTNSGCVSARRVIDIQLSCICISRFCFFPFSSDCFGDAGLAKVGDQVISCSGTSMGSWDNMLKYAGKTRETSMLVYLSATFYEYYSITSSIRSLSKLFTALYRN